MFDFQQRSFKGKSFRPFPEVLIDDKLNFFAVVTSWGPSTEIQKVLDFLQQNYQSLCFDEEQTSLYPPIESFSKQENILRTLMLSCNDWIFQKQNFGSSFKFAYEMFVAVLHDSILSFFQIGQPFVYLDREELDLQCLGSTLDFSALYAIKGKRLPPLPSHLIGLKSDISASVFSIPVQEKDRLIFLCRDFIPASFLQIKRLDRNIKTMTIFLNSYDKKIPFWLGQLIF